MAKNTGVGKYLNDKNRNLAKYEMATLTWRTQLFRTKFYNCNFWQINRKTNDKAMADLIIHNEQIRNASH